MINIEKLLYKKTYKIVQKTMENFLPGGWKHLFVFFYFYEPMPDLLHDLVND